MTSRGSVRGVRISPGAAPPRSIEGRRQVTGWDYEVNRFLAWKQAETSVGEDWLRRMRWELGRVPTVLHRAGVMPIPESAREFRAEHIGHLRRGLPWQRPTFLIHFAALRQFLRWSGNPLADRQQVWALPSGEPSHRRWLTRDQLRRLYGKSNGAARILVGLEGLNGLRRVEVLRLRVKDVLLDEGCLLVNGKGGHGGKWRKIPMNSAVSRDLACWVRHRQPDDRIIPLSRSGADLLLARAKREAGMGNELVVSHHDLRRSFGRLAHEAGMDLVQLKNMLGHASVEMSVHYIGLDSDRMREGLDRFSKYIRQTGSPVLASKRSLSY